MPMILDDLMNWVVPDPDKCRDLADELREDHPDESPEQLARRAIFSAKKWAAGTGGATGAAASPLIMIPAALADMAAVLRIEGQMAGTVAALLDPAALLDRKGFEADVIAIVFPGAVSQALRHLGVRAGRQLTQGLIRKYISENFMKEATRFAAKYLFIEITEKAVLSKTVPLVGAGIGAAWNWFELQIVGTRAVKYYQNRAIGPGAGGAIGTAVPQSRLERVRAVIRKLPWRRQTRRLPGRDDIPGHEPAALTADDDSNTPAKALRALPAPGATSADTAAAPPPPSESKPTGE